MESENSDKLSSVFLELGSQYYAIASYCASVSFNPIAATMFHHALELLMKGYLVKSYPSAELKKVGHKLSEMWSMFKDSTNVKPAMHFDRTMADLDQVELLRYPDAMVNHGFILNVRKGVPAPAQIPDSNDNPQYFVNVSDLDDIALAIFTACKVNPKACFRNTPTELAKALPPELRPLE